MQQIDPQEYIVSPGESVISTIEGYTAEQAKFNAYLDGAAIASNQPEFQFQVTGKKAEHKLILEFMPISQANVDFKLLLRGSMEGAFWIPIQLSGGMTQTRYIRFNVKGLGYTIGV